MVVSPSHHYFNIHSRIPFFQSSRSPLPLQPYHFRAHTISYSAANWTLFTTDTLVMASSAWNTSQSVPFSRQTFCLSFRLYTTLASLTTQCHLASASSEAQSLPLWSLPDDMTVVWLRLYIPPSLAFCEVRESVLFNFTPPTELRIEQNQVWKHKEKGKHKHKESIVDKVLCLLFC